MVLLTAGYVVTTALPAIGPTVNGLAAGIVGILLATIYRLGKPNIKESLTWGLRWWPSPSWRSLASVPH
jgi:chromate transport protein ChrA